jgi:hypothetical protein
MNYKEHEEKQRSEENNKVFNFVFFVPFVVNDY